MITKEQLIKLDISKENATKYIDSLNITCNKYEINTNARICQYLPHLCVESNYFGNILESLNYSQEALLKIFPSKFKSLEQTIGYGRSATQKANQEALDKKLYNGYRGRGLIQITGIANYTSVSKALNIDCVNHPELLEEPLNACLSAGFYWNSIKANPIADINNEQAVKTLTKLINGLKYMGLEERIKIWHKAKEIWK